MIAFLVTRLAALRSTVRSRATLALAVLALRDRDRIHGEPVRATVSGGGMGLRMVTVRTTVSSFPE